MSNIVRYEAGWLHDPAEIANKIGGTDFVPKPMRGNLAAITAALLYGQEVGLGPMSSLGEIHVIEGRPTLTAEAQRALIFAAGHEFWFEETTASRAIACGRRRGSDVITRVTWTIDDARRANLAGKQNWRTYPRQMLEARASAELARLAFPDVIAGLLAREELEDDPTIAEPVGNGVAPAPEPSTRRKRAATAKPAPEPDDHWGDPVPGSLPGVSVAEAFARQERDEIAAIEAEFEGAPTTPLTPEAMPYPEPEPEPLATDAQKRRMFATMRDLGIGAGLSESDARAERLAYVSKIARRTIASSNELTMSEVGYVIDALEQDKQAQAAGEQTLLDELKSELDAVEIEEPVDIHYDELPEGF